MNTKAKTGEVVLLLGMVLFIGGSSLCWRGGRSGHRQALEHAGHTGGVWVRSGDGCIFKKLGFSDSLCMIGKRWVYV